jgi:hypothetical protein
MASSGLENNPASALLRGVRPIFLLLTLLAAATVSGCAHAPPPADGGTGMTMVRVWPQWKEADSFMSISEYFTHKEMTGGWIVLRTHPESRVGFYFLTRVKNRGARAAGTRFVIHLILPSSPDPITYTFPAAVPHGSHLFEIGLTGSDWKGSRLHPVAWQVELQDAAGQVLAAKASYLWEKPGK